MNTRSMAAVAALLALGALGASAQTTGKVDLPDVQRAVRVCASCHGEGGRSTQALYPSLAGQSREYTIRQLRDFRDQSRAETDVQAYMWGISALLTDDQIVGLAEYYAAQAPRPPQPVNARLEDAGKAIYFKGLPGGVAACASCHGENAEGQAGFPRLAGLNQSYVVKQLQAFRTPLRPHGVIMKKEINAMNEAQMKAVAAYVQSR